MNRRHLVWVGWGILGAAVILWEARHGGTQPADTPNPADPGPLDTAPQPAGGGGSTSVAPHGGSAPPTTYQGQQYPGAIVSGQVTTTFTDPDTGQTSTQTFTKTAIRPGRPIA